MFNILDVSSIRDNPILAKSYIRMVPAYELTKIIIEDNKKAEILDQLSIIKGILDSSSDDLKLVLATYSTLGGWIDSVHHILELYEKGEAYRAALFGNSRIDWYYGNAILENTDNSIIGREICEDGNHLAIICRNPRMDRRVLATAIRGLEQFSKLSVEKRAEIAYLTMDVKEIESEQYLGKDRADKNELYFDDPIKALLPFLKDIFLQSGRDEFEKIFANWLWKIANIQIEIDVQDWIVVETSVDAKDQKYTTSDDYLDAYRAKWHAAFSGVVNFLNDATKSLVDEFPKKQEDYKLAVFPSVVLIGLLKSYLAKTNIQEYLKHLLTHPNWSIRAAYYASVFSVTPISESGEMMANFFQTYHLDKAEKWVGVTSTKLFQLAKRRLECELAINHAVIHSQYQVEIERIDSKVLDYLYFINTNNGDYDKQFADHNQSLKSNPLSRQVIDEFERDNISKVIDHQKGIDATLVALDEYERNKNGDKNVLQRLFNMN